MSSDDVPAPRGLHLYTAAAPSGFRATILLEELGGTVLYELHALDVSKGEHLQPEFKAVNPAQLVPALVDHDQGGVKVFDSTAILLYILECKAPAAGGEAAAAALRLLPPPSEPARRGAVLSWLSWITSTAYAAARRFFEPFLRGAPATPETTRYAAKAMRAQLTVVEEQLQQTGAYVAGDFYSAADIAGLPFVLGIATALGVDVKAELPAVHAWLERLLERPAVRRGMRIPGRYPFVEAGEEADTAVEAFRTALVGMGLDDLDVAAPRVVVPE